jgi:amino acid transporter
VKSELGFWSLFALGVNGIVGVGIFFAPREVAALVPGASGLLVYAVTGLALMPIAVAFAMLGGRFGEDGGPYVWAREAFGPAVGFGVGWIAYVSALFSTSAVVAGFAEHAAPLAGLPPRAVAVGCALVLAGVAASGLRPSALAWNTITVLKLAPLLVVAAVFAAAGPAVPRALAATEVSDFTRAALIVVFALQGFEIVPVPAGHAQKSLRAVSAATVLSLAFAVGLYLVLHAACVAALPTLGATPAPLAAAAGVLGGPGLGRVVAFGTNVSALGIAFGMFAMTPRYLAALGLAPTGLDPGSERRTPTASPVARSGSRPWS